MFDAETMWNYEEYCLDCETQGITPLPIWEWIYS